VARNPYHISGRGGYWVGTKGADEFAAALRDAAGNLRDLREIHREIGRAAEINVEKNVPVYMRRNSLADRSKWRATSRTGKRPGYLKSRVKGGGGTKSSWVEIRDDSGVLILQEFGGMSFWQQQGKGIIRSANRRHIGYKTMREWGLGQGGSSGHFIYEKPRKPRGYFIWNVAWHMRNEIADTYCRGLARIADQHGISMDIARSPALDGMKPSIYRRAA